MSSTTLTTATATNAFTLDTAVSNLNYCTSSTTITGNPIYYDYGNIELKLNSDGFTIKSSERNPYKMKIVKVKFKNGNDKVYYYRTKIEDLIKDGVYDIVADNKTEYDNYVIILDTNCEYYSFMGNLREITYARLIEAPRRPDGNVENIWINEEKGTTVIKWKDGTKTKVRCQHDEEFDAEKGIALCFMKKAFDNRACFNVIFKKYIEDEDE